MLQGTPGRPAVKAETSLDCLASLGIFPALSGKSPVAIAATTVLAQRTSSFALIFHDLVLLLVRVETMLTTE